MNFQGGHRSPAYSHETKYPSSLAPSGQVSWSTHRLESLSCSRGSAEASLIVDFPNIDWPFLQSVYGWAALQYQAWARGYLTISSSSTHSILLYTDNVLEFWVDDDHYFGGDYYNYRRVPLVLHLDSGSHNIDIRLIRDLRVMGGTGEPKAPITLRAESSDGSLALMGQKAIIPDITNGVLASPFASLPVCNQGQNPIDIVDITTDVEGTVSASLIAASPFKLAPGQTRPLSFRLSAQSSSRVSSFSLVVIYVKCESPDILLRNTTSTAFSTHSIQSPHKITFFHPGGIVSYAILRPPSKKASSGLLPSKHLPVFLNLHGAGLEADSHQVRHMLDSVPDLPMWVIFPTGVTP